MTEERAPYTTPDAVADKLHRQEQYIAQLENTCNGYLLIQHRHAETITAQAARMAELEADIARKNGALHALDVEVQRQNETIARLEAKVQSRFDHTPVTLLRYIVNSHPTLPVDDRIAASRWLTSLDGAQ